MPNELPAAAQRIAGQEYVSLINIAGKEIYERSDALRLRAERYVIEARYGYAIRHLKKAGAKTVLDMACGLGYGTWLLDRAGFQVKGVELDANALPVARARYPWITFAQGDVQQFEHELVDGIVATEFIEHIHDGRAFLRRMHELLKPDGILVMTTPNKRYTGGGNPYHVHEYTYEELRAFLPGLPIRTLTTKLFKPARLWIALFGDDRYALLNYRLSRLFPFHHLARYAHTFTLCATKSDLARALLSS
jgi:2-polyprenyl-3-methyl-5-hydroxy-6-metoxy-1,4-benzoquinol methylase